MSDRKINLTTPPIDHDKTCDMIRGVLKEFEIHHIDALLSAVSMVNTLIEIINGNRLVKDMLEIFETLPECVRSQYRFIIHLNKKIRELNSIGPIVENTDEYSKKINDECNEAIEKYVSEVKEVINRLMKMIEEGHSIEESSTSFSRKIKCPPVS